MAKGSDFIIDDIFSITAVDPDGKKFDRVSRIVGQGHNHGIKMLLDVNVEMYPISQTNKYEIALTHSISLDGDQEMSSGSSWNSRQASMPSLADKYEYVMYGRVYKFEEVSSASAAAEGPNSSAKVLGMYISFGGLLMRVEVDARRLQSVSSGSNLYLLMRKV